MECLAFFLKERKTEFFSFYWLTFSNFQDNHILNFTRSQETPKYGVNRQLKISLDSCLNPSLITGEKKKKKRQTYKKNLDKQE